MSSKRIKMKYKLKSQEITKDYEFEMIDIKDLNDLSIVMLESIKDTCEDAGEKLEDIVEEIDSVISGSFAPFIYEASYQVKKKKEIVSAIMISFYQGYPLISEIFTRNEFHKLGLATFLISMSVNSLLKLGYKELVLNVEARNTAAINLYKKIGFIEA